MYKAPGHRARRHPDRRAEACRHHGFVEEGGRSQTAGLHQSGDLVWTSDKTATREEGCLSIPEYYEEVERPAEVKVKYLDLDGKAHEIDAKGLLATCLQHEIDHTNGVLFIDYLSKLKRDRITKKFIKASEEGGGVIGAPPGVHGHAGLRRAHPRRACRRRS